MQRPIYRLAIILLLTFLYYGCDTDEAINTYTEDIDLENLEAPNLEIKELERKDIEADASLFEETRELQEIGLEIDYSAVSQVTNLDTGEITYTFFMNEDKEGEVQNLILTFYDGIFYPRVLTYKFSEDQKVAVVSKALPKGGTDIELKDIITERQDVAQDMEGRAPKKTLVAAITPTLTIWYDGGTLETVYLEGSPPEGETSASAGGSGTIHWPSGSIGLGGNLNGGMVGSGVDGSMPSTNHSGGSGGPITTPKVKPNTVIIDKSFKDNKCLNDIYETLNGKDNRIGKYLDNFIPDNSVANLTLKTDDLFKDNNPKALVNAIATTSQPKNYMIEIIFNTDIHTEEVPASARNHSSIVLAQALIHEIVHAEMYRKLLSVVGKPGIPWTRETINKTRNSFPGIADYYTRYWLELPSGAKPTDPQHEQMAAYYRDIIVSALKDYGGNKYTDDEYEAIAWVGLKETASWKNLKDKQGNINKKINKVLREPACM